MRLLIIDYGTDQLPLLQEWCGKHDTTVVQSSEDSGSMSSDFDGIVLIGDYNRSEAVSAEQCRATVAWLEPVEKPVFGLGFGFELVCLAYGVELADLAERAEAAGKVIPTDDGAKLFQGSDPILVQANVRWCVEELPKGLPVLARSESGIEAIRHKTRPIYGLQQQPGDFSYASDGKMIIQNLLSLCGKRA